MRPWAGLRKLPIFMNLLCNKGKRCGRRARKKVCLGVMEKRERIWWNLISTPLGKRRERESCVDGNGFELKNIFRITQVVTSNKFGGGDNNRAGGLLKQNLPRNDDDMWRPSCRISGVPNIIMDARRFVSTNLSIHHVNAIAREFSVRENTRALKYVA